MIRLEQRLFLLFVALLPFFQPFFVRLRGTGPIVILADVVFAMAMLAWLINLARRRTTLRPTRFYLFGGLYLAAFFVSAFVSPDPGASLTKLPGVVYLIGISVLTFNLVRSWDDVKRVLQMWIAATAVVGLVGVVGIVLFYVGIREREVNFALFQFGSLPPGDYPRLQATFANANAMCSYMGIGLLLLPLTHSLGWMTTAWHRAISAAAWPTVLLSLSPGLGGVLLARGWWEWARRHESRRRLLGGGAALAAGIGAALAFFLATLVEPAPRGIESTVVLGREVEPSVRVLLWRRALGEIADRPFLGKGVGMGLDPFTYVNAAGETQRLTDAHNTWLNVTVQTGLVGLAAFVALVVYVWRCTRSSPRDERRTELVKVALRGAFATVLLYQGLSGSFEDSRHLWALMGLMVGVGDET